MNYIIKQYPDKKFTDKMDQTRFIKKHLEELKEIKKAEYKTNSQPIISGLKTKMFEPEIEDITSDFIEVKTVINSTNIIDSHLDLHMPKIWNKTVSDNPYSHHLKQHENKFESVISKKAKSYNEDSNFNLLGLDVDFKCVANINQFILERSKIPFMFDAYKNGDVDQHSVGMLYVDLDIAYYDEDSQKQMDFFNEMKEKSVNPDVAEEYGYFWVIYEAKKREGSAVVFGSNSVTPTLWVKNYEPQNSTQKEAAKALHARKQLIINHLNN
ncbi:hypothetical protein [uncultured Winogradskyella sp.]|uniref:hypothetical protein n=1 Tax=uncultured Winogradskyella sp. TaxID=395353 RepID=UPI002626A25B|nr:hypothetical protein [uncultured Winogradskyella sp.]